MTAPAGSSQPDHRLADLVRLMTPLEPDEDARRRLTDLAVSHAESFLASAHEAPTWVPSEGVAGALERFGIPEQPRDPEEVLEVVSRLVEQPGVATTSPRYVGYIPSGGLFSAAVADFLAAVSNRYAGQGAVNPGAAGLEHVVVRWLADVLGLGEAAGGVLTSGGSIAALTAVVTAREATGALHPGAATPVVYLGEYTHHSFDLAVRIAGLGSAVLRRVPSDAAERMDVDALARAVADDRSAGLRPLIVVGTAGTTASGSVDPLDRMADVARREDLWFHVDGAYGGLFALSPLARDVLSGIERADSVVVDPHKTLFLPYGTGAVLVRDRHVLEGAFTSDADYFEPRPLSEPASPSDLGPELTRHFRALRVWLPLQLAGRDAFTAALTEKILLARHAHARLAEIPGVVVGRHPDLSIVTFRASGAGPESEAATVRLARDLQRLGDTYPTTTRLRGRTVIRVAVGSFRTHLADVDRVVEAVRRSAADAAHPARRTSRSGARLRLEFRPGPADVEILACEAAVLGQRYGNTAEELAAAYDAYRDVSAFLAVRDGADRVVGWARLITPGPLPIKTLADVAAPPWNVDLDAVVAEAALDPSLTWDVTTIGVRRELGASGSTVAAALYHGIIAATRANGADWITALLDVRVRKLLDRVGLVTDTLPGTAEQPYFGSSATIPVFANMERMVARQQREQPESYRRITLGLGLDPVVLPAAEDYLLVTPAVDLRDVETRTA